MTLVANVLTVTLAKSVISDKIHALRIHVKREVNVDDKVMISNARVRQIAKVNCVNWNVAMPALVIRVRVVVRVEKVQMARHSSAYVDRVIEEISVKQLLTLADPIHACMVDFVLASNPAISK
jgi:bacteriorhodopsin